MAATTKAIRTRGALLLALQELMLDPAQGGVSVPRLVAHAGISQGTFYNYFDSLPDAVDAVGALIFSEHLRVLEVLNAGVSDPVEVITRTTRQTMLLAAHRPDVGTLLWDSGLPPERLLLGFRFHLRADLQTGVDRGCFALADLDSAASVLSGALQGACLDIYRGRLPVKAIPDTIDCVLRVLGIDKARRRRLAHTEQDFVPWRALPLDPLHSPDTESDERRSP